MLFKGTEDEGPNPSQHRTIEFFNAGDCKHCSKFTQENLVRLFHLLRFPYICNLGFRREMSGEDAFLLGFVELRSGTEQQSITVLVPVEISQCSRGHLSFRQLNDNLN